MIAVLARQHVRSVVAVHLAGFEGFFLSFLGPRFLRLYYEGIVDYPDGVGFVYLEGGRVVGFVCGVVGPSHFYRYLIRTRLWRFAMAAWGAILCRPAIVPRLVRALFYSGRTSSAGDDATLTSITIEPAMQGKGIGTKLVSAFLGEMCARGVKRVRLTTDRYDNSKVNALYERRGFCCERTFTTPEGRVMNEYVIQLE